MPGLTGGQCTSPRIGLNIAAASPPPPTDSEEDINNGKLCLPAATSPPSLVSPASTCKTGGRIGDPGCCCCCCEFKHSIGRPRSGGATSSSVPRMSPQWC